MKKIDKEFQIRFGETSVAIVNFDYVLKLRPQCRYKGVD